MTESWIPSESNGEIVAPDALEAAQVREGLRHWRNLAGARSFPAAVELKPWALGTLQSHLILVRVLEGGADYAYHTVGAALTQGFNENFAGRNLSDIIAGNPTLGLGLKMLYDMVRQSGAPVGYRGWTGRDMGGAEFLYHENILLPLGPGADTVDHVMIVSAIVLKRDTRS